jgi:agarase
LAQRVTYLDAYMGLPDGAPGKRAVQDFVEERYDGDLDRFNTVWGRDLADFEEIQQLDHLAGKGGVATEQAADRRAFRQRVAERYYGVVATALDAVEPAMLYLGDRYLVGGVPPDVVQEAARWVDVVSINRFVLQPSLIELFRASLEMSGQLLPADDFSDLDALAESAGKPVLVSSFSFRAEGERTPNSWPPFVTLPDQAARAAAYETAMGAWLERPYIVGAHWFQYMDQPAIGRAGDGEDNNFGLVDIDDRPYHELLDAMARVAAQIYHR